MKRISKVLVLTLFLLFLIVSCANASELENNVQDKDMVDLGIDEEVSSDSNELNLEPELEDNLVEDDFAYESDDNPVEDVLGDESDDDIVQDSLDHDSVNKNSLRDDSTTVHQLNPTTYSSYFNSNGYVKTDVVSPGDTIDLSGRFNKKNFIFNIACSITSSQNDAYMTNCMIKYENVTSDIPSYVSNLKFNTSIEMSPCVYVLGSTNVNVFNCNAYSTGANSNPTLLVGSSYCNIHDNVFETTFSGYMNMSWKRAGILLGESHYNKIYSNHVTVKDSNGIYLTTYGYEKSNYNIIFNNTVSTSAFSNETGLRNPSAWAYGVHIMGDYNQILNNTIMNTYRGVDSEGSFNQIIGNRIFNLSGSYYEGNNGTDGGEGGIYASYNNVIINNTIYDSKITGTAIYVVVNNTVIGNTIYNITGPYGIQFALTASNCLVDNNTISMNTGNSIQVKGNMSNLTISNNVISNKNGTGLLILKQTRAKYPVDVTILNNIFLEDLNVYINYTDVLGKTVVNLLNNTVVVVNETFFRFFDPDGSFSSNEYFENFIFKGEFSDLIDSSESGLDEIESITLNGRINIIGENAYIRDISFNINSDNVKIDGIFVNITDAIANTFNFSNVNKCTLNNSIIYFNSIGSPNEFVPIFANFAKVDLENNTIIVYSDNTALVLNNTNCSLLDNLFNSSSLNHVVILNDNNSILYYGENEIISLVDPAVISINGAIILYTYFIIDDSNYYEYFNPDGSFLDDVIFNFGDTIRIGNVNNKLFRFDIPLVIVGEQGTIMNNSFIFLEGESSESIVCNFTFNLEDYEYAGDISVITIKDGVSNILVDKNRFNVNNLSGEYTSLNLIKINPSDIVSSNILIEDNVMTIDSNLSQINGICIKNEGMSLANQVVDNLKIINNSISIINSKEASSSNGILLLSCSDSMIFNNSIYIRSYPANGLILERSNLTINNNSIVVDGLNYERIIDHIEDDSLRELVEDGFIKADCAIAIDRDTCLNDDVFEENVLLENGAKANVIHSSNSLKDLEYIIQTAQNGSTIDLGNNVYVVHDSIYIDKSLNIINGIMISNLNDDVLFDILTSSDDSINISNASVILDNANVFILIDSLDDDNPTVINVPSLNISENEFLAIGNHVVPESITLVKLSSDKKVLNTNNPISIVANQIAAGMKPFEFDVKSIANGSDIHISNDSPSIKKTPSRIVYSDMVTTAVDTATDGRIGEYFNVTLVDENGNPLANKSVQIGFNGKVYERTTDENGRCSLQINLQREGIFTFAISFLGDDIYEGSFAVAKITVKKQVPVISTANYYFKASAKNKKISISLKSASRKPLSNKTVKLTVNGKTYSGKTNSNGLVTINVSLSTKKTYSFTVKYVGDSTYSAVSKTAKVVIS